MPKGTKFPDCKTCLNREHDPFQCQSCEDASNYEPEDTEEDVSYDDFLEQYRNGSY